MMLVAVIIGWRMPGELALLGRPTHYHKTLSIDLLTYQIKLWSVAIFNIADMLAAILKKQVHTLRTNVPMCQ